MKSLVLGFLVLGVLLTRIATIAPADDAKNEAIQKVRKPTTDTRPQDVEELIQRYFRTWSAQDMNGYGNCFLGNACVQYIDSDGQLDLYTLDQFLTYQRKLHRASQYRQTEAPESIDVHFESKLARVVVYWKLTAGTTTQFGYDHFTLAKYRGRWRIANLVFYTTKTMSTPMSKPPRPNTK